MKADREFFDDMCQRLTAGQQVLSYHFPNRFFIPDKDSGLMLVRGEDGTEYELGHCFCSAFNAYIKTHRLAWCISIIEQTITIGPGVISADFCYQRPTEGLLKPPQVEG